MLLEAIAVLAVVLVAWLLIFREEHAIDKLPGPPKYPIIGCAIELFKTPPNDLLYTLVNYTKKFGDRYCFKVMSLRVLHISNPQDIEVVLTHSRNIQKSIAYDFLKDWLGSGLLVSTGSYWHKRRKILTPTFHFNILKNFANIIEENTQELVTKLKQKNSAEVDITPIISDFTLFTICETAMGTKLNGDQSSATFEYKKSILTIGYEMLYRITRVWLHNDFIYNMTSKGKEFGKTLETARSFAENVIKDRKAKRQSEVKIDNSSEDFGTKKRLAMLDLLLEAEEKGEIDMDGIKDEVNTFMFEGHDTTALALTFGLMLLADHEDVQNRIYEECQSILGDSNRVPELSDLANMKYLEAVIKETLRLYPSVPFIGRHITEDFMMGDLLIKKGTAVDIHFYELHRREDMFPEPEVFKPERFLSGEMKHPYAYVPFSAGPRNCIGQRFAMQEMKSTLCEIVRNFKLVPKIHGFRPKLLADLVLRPVEPIYIQFIPRNNSR